MAHLVVADKRIGSKKVWIFWMAFGSALPFLVSIGIIVGIVLDYQYDVSVYPELLEKYQRGELFPKPSAPNFPTVWIVMSLLIALFLSIIVFILIAANMYRVLYSDKEAIVFNEGRKLFSVATDEGRVTVFLRDIISIQTVQVVVPTPKKEGEFVENPYGRLEFTMRGRKGVYTVTSIPISSINVIFDRIGNIHKAGKVPEGSSFPESIKG